MSAGITAEPGLVWSSEGVSPSVRLNTGALMPALAFGTGAMPRMAAGKRRLRSSRRTLLDRINMSLALGYRHIDTAEVYAGFDVVGNVVRRWSTQDHPIFLTSKVDPTRTPGRRGMLCNTDGTGCRAAMMRAANDTVRRLGVVPSLLLLHRPPQRKSNDGSQCIRLRESWRGLEEAHNAGLAHAIGLSNCCGGLLRCLARMSLRYRPAVLQYMHHIGMGQDPFGYRTWGRRQWNATYMAYSVLGGAEGDFERIARSPIVQRVAVAHSTGGANVALSWVAQQGLPLVILSSSSEHLREDVSIFSTPRWGALSRAEMEALSSLREPRGRPSHWGDCEDVAVER